MPLAIRQVLQHSRDPSAFLYLTYWLVTKTYFSPEVITQDPMREFYVKHNVLFVQFLVNGNKKLLKDESSIREYMDDTNDRQLDDTNDTNDQ